MHSFCKMIISLQKDWHEKKLLLVTEYFMLNISTNKLYPKTKVFRRQNITQPPCFNIYYFL